VASVTMGAAKPIAKLPRLCNRGTRPQYAVEVVYGNLDPQVVQRNDGGEYGYQVRKLKFKCGVQLPFVSDSGKRVVWYAGWQPSGLFGLKFNLHSREN
jgi:hypothetical protein